MSEAHIFSDEYYARLARQEETHWWSLGMRAIAARLLDRFASPHHCWRALDAGCGTGLTMQWLKRYTDMESIGLDLARAGLDFCARRGSTRLVEASTTVLPFASRTFDLVVSTDVIQHLPRPHGDNQAFAELTRVLVPGGLLLLRTNSRCGYPATNASDYHRYTLAEVRALVASAGLLVHTASYVNCLPGLLASARLRLSRANATVDPGLRAVSRPPGTNWVTRLFYRSLLAEAAFLAPGGRALPFGHSILLLAQKC